MGQFLLLLVVALTVGAVVFGVTVLLTGGDPGLSAAEPDGRAVPLPGTRPLVESDIAQVRFDTALRGYRMAQVDQAMRRAAYDIGYKEELIGVLEAEVTALRSGRFSDAEVLRRAREAAAQSAGQPEVTGTTGADDPDVTGGVRAETALIDLGAAGGDGATTTGERPGADKYPDGPVGAEPAGPEQPGEPGRTGRPERAGQEEEQQEEEQVEQPAAGVGAAADAVAGGTATADFPRAEPAPAAAPARVEPKGVAEPAGADTAAGPDAGAAGQALGVADQAREPAGDAVAQTPGDLPPQPGPRTGDDALPSRR